MDVAFLRLLMAALVAGLWFLIFFIGGVVVSARGQLLRAHLDEAINSSPFLTLSMVARMLRLTPSLPLANFWTVILAVLVLKVGEMSYSLLLPTLMPSLKRLCASLK